MQEKPMKYLLFFLPLALTTVNNTANIKIKPVREETIMISCDCHNSIDYIVVLEYL